jgi:hypothetical protein
MINKKIRTDPLVDFDLVKKKALKKKNFILNDQIPSEHFKVC